MFEIPKKIKIFSLFVSIIAILSIVWAYFIIVG